MTFLFFIRNLLSIRRTPVVARERISVSGRSPDRSVEDLSCPKSRRFPLIFLSLILLGFLSAFCFTDQAKAQNAPTSDAPKLLFKQEQIDKFKEEATKVNTDGWRKTGKGHYFSILKVSCYLLLFWLWLATTTWINNDAERLGDEDRLRWNVYVVSIFAGSFFPLFMIPLFWIGFPCVLLAFFFPLFQYIAHRNYGKLASEKVMTREHIWYVLCRLSGKKVKAKKATYELGSPIQLLSGGKEVDKETKNGRTILARNMPGFNSFREILYYSLKRNATAVGVEFTPDQVKYQFEIDGIWHPIEGIFKRPLTLEEANDLCAAAKTLMGLNVKDRRSRQTGLFHIEYDKKKKADADFVSQGSKVGELFIIRFLQKKIPFSLLDELGMPFPRVEKFQSWINSEKGLIVFSAQTGQGLKTLTHVALSTSDRFTRDFVTVEDLQNPYQIIENVSLNTYDSKQGQKPNDILPDVFFKEPKTVLVRDLINTETLTLCCEEVKNNRVIITTFRGKDSAETLMRILSTGVDPKLIAETLLVIVTQKLVRRLCPTCREEIPANPALIKRFSIKEGSISKIFRKRVYPAPQPGEKNTYKPCMDCNELGYNGRIGIYDFLEMNDAIRQVITSEKPTIDAIRKAATDSGQHGFLVDGGPLVADGTTSFEELSRILK